MAWGDILCLFATELVRCKLADTSNLTLKSRLI